MKNNRRISIYDQFNCTADQCPMTCCQEWKISVDEDTENKWQEIDKENGFPIRLQQEIKVVDETRVIGLNQEKKCPFLNEKKLCKLVLGLGEGVLSKTCHTFPRLENKLESGIEYSLTACCPAVIDLMYQEEKIEINRESEKEEYSDSLFQIREFLLKMIQNKNFSIEKNMMMMFFLLLEKPKDFENSISKKNLDGMNQEINQMKFDHFDTFVERNELVLDLIDNYRKQGLYTKYLEPIAGKAEEVEEDCDENIILDKVQIFEKVFLSYENIFRNYLTTEIFASCLTSESDYESIVVAFQWIALEYVTMKHCIFLMWLNNEEKIDYTTVREIMVVISRVMGYDAEDIKEYLENSFDHVVWEWGYLALIIGNL